MGKLIDLTGRRFGRLTVIQRSENGKDGRAKWLCVCDCGCSTIVRGDRLRSGKTTSCGCLAIETRRNIHFTHGHSGTRVYNIWQGMKKRCYNPKNAHYNRYGGRGIAVCEEWLHNFQVFYNWAMANGYRDDLSIDRIDNDKDYSADNCRWVTCKENNNNTSSNKLICINGTTMTLKQWSEKKHVNYSTVRYRIYSGWTIKEALGLVPRNKS